MSMEITQTALTGYFYTNWTATIIQYFGVKFPHEGTIQPTKWISLKFVPVINELVAYNGTDTGVIEYNAQLQVFVYDVSPSKAIKLADSVCTFLNGKRFNPDIVCGIGSATGAPLDLETGVFEVMLVFEVSNYA